MFDAKSETAPLAGVQHWARAVRHAHPAAAGGLTTFLVAARADRGGINVSDQRIQKLMADFALDDYFKTSAKEGTNIDLLRSRLLAAIDWTRIPEVTSTALFAAVKQFVVDQKTSGSLLTPIDELCRMFQEAVPSGLQLLTGQEQPADPAGDGPPEILVGQADLGLRGMHRPPGVRGAGEAAEVRRLRAAAARVARHLCRRHRERRQGRAGRAGQHPGDQGRQP